MKKGTFTEEQIVYALRQAEAGTAVADVCRKLGVSENTFYRWKRKFAGLGIAELRRLKQLEEENRKLKQLIADLSLDKHMLQEALRKKLVKPAQKRAVVSYFRVGFKVSERRACAVAGVPRASCRYQSQAKDQTALRLRLRDRARARVRYGYRRLHILLACEGWRVNHKRVCRLYRQDGLSLRLKARKKRVSRPRVPPPAAERPNQRWSMDFVADRLADGRRFRVLTFVDNVSRVSPAIEVDFSLTGERVVVVLDRLKASYGLPGTGLAGKSGIVGRERGRRMRALAVPWTAEELERRYSGAASALAAKRYQALWLRAQGVAVKAVAATVGVTAETVRAWVKRGAAEGLDALAGRKPGSGGRHKLTAAQREAVLGWVDAAPRVTMPALRARIAGEWGVSLSEPQVWKLVRRGGGRRVVPRTQHYQADPARQARAEKN